MRKLVVLKLDGDLQQGVRVTLEIGEEDSRPSTEITAQLPPYPDLVTAIDQWQSTYRSLGQSSRLEAKKIVYGGSITQWRSDCDKSVVDLRSHLHNWLLSESFRPIREKWLQQLSPSDEVRVLIRTSSSALRKLPWHLWDLVEDYPKAEVAYCAPESEQPTSSKTPTYRDQVRILAILGNSTGINVQKDRQLLENLPDAATTFLVEPQRQDINDQLWNQPWDILFFAGHSQSEGDTGRIFINQTDSLTIAQLKYGLRNAVAGGLQLAIFNSCDGLGLAIELQELHLGQMIVMREPVPDLVAQTFLTDFLAAFARGKSFYLSQREAREKLHGLEDNFPCASWLPMIFQNLAGVPPMWQELGRHPTDVCPYRGLFAFREEDSPFFYGRDAFTQMLVAAVQQQSLVAVIGPSGSGKSSVVFAGLIPRLRQVGNWRIVSFRPGDRPFRNLAAKLVPLLETQMSETDQLLEINKQTKALREGDLALRDVVTRILEKNLDSRFLLVVDQFEELYTLCRDARERLLFLDSLLEMTDRTPNFTLVLTLRADFLGQALSYRPFGDALQYADLKLSPMNREELQAAVEQPAKMLGVTIESGLTERILDAVSAEPGDLPLLEFALNQLWAKQRDAQLTHAAYEEIGGVEAALSRYAEEAYGRLNEEEKERARRIFIQLVRPGEGTEDTRRLATRTEVGEENWDLVTRLASDRLVVSSRDEALGEETVEIVHEALIGGWERLNLWIELDRNFRTWQERLRASLRQWEASGKDEGALLRGVPLAEAEGWLQSRAVELSLSERSFIERSAKARTRQRRRLVFGLSVGLVGALTLAGIAGLQWQRAEKQRQIAVVGQLAAQANSAREQFKLQPTEALLSAMRSAYELKRLSQGEAEWLRGETKGEIFKPILVLQTFLDNIREQKFSRRNAQSTEVQFSPKGDRVIASESTTESHIDTVWDLQGNQLATLKGHQRRVETAQLSPDGKYILTAGGGYTAELWNLQGKQLAVLKGYDDRINWAQFSSDGKHIVTIHSNRTRLWNLQGNLIAVFEEQLLRKFWSFQYSPDGQHIVTLHGKDPARLWDLQGNLIAVFKEGRFGIRAAQFRPDGQQLITISGDGSTKLWDIHGKQAVLAGEQDRIARFSPDGKRFIKIGNGIVRLFDLQGKQLAAFKSHQPVIAVQFSPDGNSIVTRGIDDTARLWNLQGKQLAVFKGSRAIPISELGYLRPADPVQFSPDGKRLATTEAGERGSNIIRVWDFRGNSLGVFNIYTPNPLETLQFSPDGKYLAAHAYKVTYLLHLQGNQLATFAGQQGKVKTVQFSPDGKHVTTLGEDRTVRLWNSRGDRLATFKARQGYIEQVQFSPRGDRILTNTRSPSETVQIRNLQGNQLAVLNGSWGDNWHNLIISPDGKYVVTRGEANRIQIWDMEGNQVGISPTIPGIVSDLRFSPKGDSIATAGGGMIRLWDLRGKELAAFKAASESERVSTVYLNSEGKPITNAEELAALKAADKADSEIIRAFYFTSDGKRIITTTESGFRVWVLKGNQLAAIEKDPFSLEAATYTRSSQSVFHPESGRFMTRYLDDIAFQRDLKGKQLATLQGREGWFQWFSEFNFVGERSTVQLSSDGDRIATLGTDGMVRVWDSKGQLMAEYEGYAMALSRDGKRIVVVSKDNIPRMWRVYDLDGLLKRGCDWLRPYLALGKGDDSDRKMCGISGVK